MSNSPIAIATLRSIPSLDGLRACSVAIVILGHSLSFIPGRENRFPFVQAGWLGQSGVDVFFVISGFLITYLLLKELEATGSIRLRNFYFRRLFRIFPPFYAFLGVVGILWAAGALTLSFRNFVSAGTYTYNYFGRGSWILAHTWSLSLEEQFYLLWPPCLALFGKRKSIYCALGVILCSPLSRFFTYLLASSLRGNEGIMLHTRLDMIMFGCVTALLWGEPHFREWVDRLLHPGLFIFAVLYIILLAPCLSARFQGRYDWSFGYMFRGLLIALVLLYVVNKPASRAGRFLNRGLIRHVGVISYSLYLWQQLFVVGLGFLFPVNLIAMLAAAELSYRLIECPSFKLRDRLGAHLYRGQDAGDGRQSNWHILRRAVAQEK